MNAASLLFGALNQWRIIAIAAALAFAAMQSHRIAALRADLSAMTTRNAEAETLLNTCRSSAEDARHAAEAAITAGAAREKAASETAARQAEKAIALARLKAPAACSEGVAWATAQARAIAQEWKQ